MFFKKLLKDSLQSFDRGKRTRVLRSQLILRSMVGSTFYIHSGKKFRRVSVVRSHVGFKFGEFCFTRRVVKHKVKKKKKK